MTGIVFFTIRARVYECSPASMEVGGEITTYAFWISSRKPFGSRAQSNTSTRIGIVLSAKQGFSALRGSFPVVSNTSSNPSMVALR